MTGIAVVMNCLLSVAAALAAPEVQGPTYSATLANGVTVELLAVADQ